MFQKKKITEVKQHWAKLVLRWVTAWEYLVPISPCTPNCVLICLNMLKKGGQATRACRIAFTKHQLDLLERPAGSLFYPNNVTADL